jgi:DMSO/TMAO reductase YedYZ molybdopterin-dependent catalytic subunit
MTTFHGKQTALERDPRLPPGQYDVQDRWPVLHAGTIPDAATAAVASSPAWTMTVDGTVERTATWSLTQLKELPSSSYDGPIHCVTRWSKFGLRFTGISLDVLFDAVETHPDACCVLAHSVTGYTSSLRLDEVRGRKAWAVYAVDDNDLSAEHGGPLRLLVPDRYLWKSVKWLTRIEILDRAVDGFWERLGYHHRGEPWAQERYENGPRW